MKRALSLIIVLTMILCMIPFSSFAADFETGDDFVDGVIDLGAKEERSFLWVATEVGTVTFTAAPVTPELEEGQEAPDLPAPKIYIDDSEEEYDGSVIAVEPGDQYCITVLDGAQIGGKVTIIANFKGVLGTETNPIMIQKPLNTMEPDPTITLEPGVVTYFDFAGFANDEVVITGAGVKVSKDDVIYGDAQLGSDEVKIQFAANDRIASLTIVNKTAETQTYVVTTTVKVGTMDNPEVVPAGTYDKTFAAGEEAYFYQYNAVGDGTVTVSVSAVDANDEAIGWMFCVNNLTAPQYGDNIFFDNEENIDSVAINVSKDDKIVINSVTWDWATYSAAAGTTTTTIEFVPAGTEEPDPSEPTDPVDPPEPSEPEIEYIHWGSILAGVTSHTNETDADQYYTYTVEQDGKLYNSSWGWAMDVLAGEVYNIYVGPGETVELYYASPVAMIGDAEYYTIEDAVMSAWEGDTIVLKDNVTAEAGIVLNPGVSLDLGEYTLEASYVMAFEPVTGVVGSASIVAGRVMLNNVTIDGVEYAWTAGENGYTLVEVVVEEPTPEEPEVKDPVAKIGDVPFATVEDALNAANSGDTVVMINHSVEENATLLIKAGVVLDIKAYSLTALNILGLNTGYITGTTYHDDGRAIGRIYVDPDNVSIGMTAAPGSSGYSIIPIYYNDCFVLTQVKLDVVKKEYQNDGNSYYWEFGFLMSGRVKNVIVVDGTSDNEVDIAVSANWNTTSAALTQTFVYNDQFVNNFVTQSKTLSGSIGGLLSKSDVEIEVMFATSSGVVVSVPIL